MDYLASIATEQPNPRSSGIDKKTTREILQIINTEDKSVPSAVERELAAIGRVVDVVVDCFGRGGRLFYVGAGTSGRLGVLDAAECPPTFGTPPEMVQAIIAGGREALDKSIELVEDSPSDGARAVDRRGVGEGDFLMGITASGYAPFVIGAMKKAGELGATVGALSCNRQSLTFEHADYKIFIDVGSEIVSGSTRLKSGTAQKLVLNMISTASMIKLGKVYNNLMVDFKPVNSKLIARSKRLIRLATGCSESVAVRVFEESGRQVKTAIVMAKLEISSKEAEKLLEEHTGKVGNALESYKKF